MDKDKTASRGCQIATDWWGGDDPTLDGLGQAIDVALRKAHDRQAMRQQTARPRIVCLCGSTRFWETFLAEQLRLTLDGVIVLSLGFCAPDATVPVHPDTAEGQEQKHRLDVLCKRKIDLADEVRVLNVGGYVDDSTWSEIEYAMAQYKIITWLVGESLPRVEASERATGIMTAVLPRIITPAWLEARVDCPEAVARVRGRWPEGAEVTAETLVEAVGLGLDITRLTQFLPPPIRARFNVETAPSRVRYDADVAPIWMYYDAGGAPIWPRDAVGAATNWTCYAAGVVSIRARFLAEVALILAAAWQSAAGDA